MLGLGKQHHFTTWTGSIHRSPNQSSTADGKNNSIGATPFGLREHALNDVLSACINRASQTVSGRNGMTLRIKVRGEHACSGAPGKDGVHDADGALSDHQHRVV